MSEYIENRYVGKKLAGPCLWIFCWFLGKNWRGPGALGTLGAPLLLICATCP